jgi:hypothetical protein
MPARHGARSRVNSARSGLRSGCRTEILGSGFDGSIPA